MIERDGFSENLPANFQPVLDDGQQLMDKVRRVNKYFAPFGEKIGERKPEILFFDQIDSNDRANYGGKACGLASLGEIIRRTGIEVSVPPGFVLPVDRWRRHFISCGIEGYNQEEIAEWMCKLEIKSGRKFGSGENPLLVSVRSGAKRSMPGAMITLLNIGLNDKTVKGLAQRIGTIPAYETYFGHIREFGAAVWGINKDKFEQLRRRWLAGTGKDEIELTVQDYQQLVVEAKQVCRVGPHGQWRWSDRQLNLYQRGIGWMAAKLPQVLFNWLAGLELSEYLEFYRRRNYAVEFPQDVGQQLRLAMESVWESWYSRNAWLYREEMNIPDNLGTAVIVQQMVFGNSQTEGSGSGVLMSTHQVRGGGPVVAFAPQAQGTAVVGEASHQLAGLAELPVTDTVRHRLSELLAALEGREPDPHDVEFTVESNTVYALQDRELPLGPLAEYWWLKQRCGLSGGELTFRMKVNDLQRLLVPALDPVAVAEVVAAGRLLGEGVSISSGVASGRVVRSVAAALAAKEPVVLISDGLRMEDFSRVGRAKNLTAVVVGGAGLGSHLARRAAQLEMPVIFDFAHRGEEWKTRGQVTVDGYEGQVYAGLVATNPVGGGRLSRGDRREVAWMLELNLANPWRYNSPDPDRVGWAAAAGAERMALRLDPRLRSIKAQEVAAVRLTLPEEMRMRYQVVQLPDAAARRWEVVSTQVNAFADRWLKVRDNRGEQRYDVTVRVGSTPHDPGKNPWWQITEMKQIPEVLSGGGRSKYGPVWGVINNREITELILGSVPRGKLDPALAERHAVWTLMIGAGGGVILQVRPRTAHLRDLEKTDGGLATYQLEFAETASGVSTDRVARVRIGENLREDAVGLMMTELVYQQIAAAMRAGLGQQMGRILDLPELKPGRLVAVRNSNGRVTYQPVGVAVMEGQARIGEILVTSGRAELCWLKVYGIKTI